MGTGLRREDGGERDGRCMGGDETGEKMEGTETAGGWVGTGLGREETMDGDGAGGKMGGE